MWGSTPPRPLPQPALRLAQRLRRPAAENAALEEGLAPPLILARVVNVHPGSAAAGSGASSSPAAAAAPRPRDLKLTVSISACFNPPSTPPARRLRAPGPSPRPDRSPGHRPQARDAPRGRPGRVNPERTVRDPRGGAFGTGSLSTSFH